MSKREALRRFLRTTKALALMDETVNSDDPVWAEDELMTCILAAIENVNGD